MNKFIILLLAISFLLLASPATAFASTLGLEPATGTFNKGCSFSINVLLDTQGTQTDGTDAIIIYDPTRFTAQNIINGTIYPDFPGNNIDSAAGKITISGLASVATAFSGKGTLATMNFTVKDMAPTGSTQMTFEFDPNDKAKTTDSNVVETNTIADTLNSVTNGNYTVGTGTGCGAQVSPTAAPGSYVPPSSTPRVGGPTYVNPPATPSGTYIPPKQPLPPAGTQEFTSMIAIVGSVLTILGILGLALL